MKLITSLTICGLAAALCLTPGQLHAQDDGGGPGGPPGGPGGPGGGFGGPGGPGGPGGNFDPAQFQQRMLDQTRQTLAITNDDDWASIMPLVQKVMDAQRDVQRSGGMRGGRGGFGGGQGGPGGGGPDGPGGQGGQGGFGQQASAEQQALQKALDSNAAVPEVKTALANVRAGRKAKQTALETAQENLRAVLTVRQEARAVLTGLLP